MDPFSEYAHKALSNKPAVLLGPIARRADARARYAEIVSEIAAISDPENLEVYLISIDRELIQFQAELDFFWEGDDDFLGLEKEIERARARVDDRLDMPRWDTSGPGFAHSAQG